MSDRNRWVIGYRFLALGEPLEIDLRAGEFRNTRTGAKRNASGALFTTYLAMLLEKAIESPDNPEVLKSEFDLTGRSDHAVSINSLRKRFAELIKRADIRKVLPHAGRSKTGTTYKINVTDVQRIMYSPENTLLKSGGSPMATYLEMNACRTRGEAQLPALMTRLQELFPTELDGFFFQSDGGTTLPFHVMDEATYGKPNWPISIVNDTLATPGKDRGASSLVHQRWLEGANLYNGFIYQLMNASPEGWVFGRTRYFDVLDSCDILRDRILGVWGKVCDNPSSTVQNKALKSSPFVQEWLDNIRAIRQGDFSGYAAGIAMNMPILAVRDDALVLLMGQGTVNKAAGGGKYHVCPAGMLEFYRNTISDTVSFADFRTYLVKELYEEGLRDPIITNENDRNVLEGNLPISEMRTLETLPDDRGYGDYVDTDFLESIFIRIEERMMKFGVGAASALKLSKHARSLQPDTPTYQVLDAFRLRPEIIVPIFPTQLPNLFLGWEYEGKTADIRRFESSEDLEILVRQESVKWAEPGLAGVYLACRDYFRAG